MWTLGKHILQIQVEVFHAVAAIGEAEQYYTLTYMLDGTKYREYSFRKGEIITPVPVPSKGGYTYSGWSEIPETMPDHDVTEKYN